MRIELTCRSCNNTFQIPFRSSGLMLENCPHCQCKLFRTDDEKLYNMVERAEFFSQQLVSIKLERIIDDGYSVEDCPQNNNSIFQKDIDELIKVYETASPEVKKKVDNIIDKIFLLLYNDVKNSKIDSLESLHSALNTIFLQRIDKKQEAMNGFLLGENE